MHPIYEISKVTSPAKVADAMLRSVGEEPLKIFPGSGNRALDRLHRLSRRPLRAYFDRLTARGLSDLPAGRSGKQVQR